MELVPAHEQIIFDYVTAAELEVAIKHEHIAFPPDEADSPEQFRYRFKHARHLFLGAFTVSAQTKGRKLIGHVCGTQSPVTYYTKESMSVHVPSSPSICVHSVVLLESYQKKGIGLQMMREYLLRIQRQNSTLEAENRQGKPERVLLVTHDDVRPFYEKAGFICKGKSDVVLGAGMWYEMSYPLKPSGSNPSK
ncbi:hypothetical protein D9756_004428 [Leucocoprinus leucothites]|uniref:N-acetyltransferase domain-containing protein n=1 Tax=Leucocoprinus leucothites TaxID=201217 RepID=A0A8H5G8K3_9AGAR|nr:hypothetical protein D9756_004428 [Leucoagaricus leucothites]